MTKTVHNPDQYIFDFKHIISHGRKKIGLLIGAGAPVSVNISQDKTYKPLIPNVEGLTNLIRERLEGEFKHAFEEIEKQIHKPNIELVLSRIRALAEVIGESKICGLNADGFQSLSKKICSLIYEIVSKPLPVSENPFSDTISWINGINRNHSVEIFTTNYDLLFEEAMERVKTPYFDGFSGSRIPFFDPSSISNNDLPKRWVRLWKLHGSIGWSKSESGEIVRSNTDAGSTMVYPSHIKYDQTQSAPFSSLFERLKNFLLEPDTLLICSGFSFADAHISAKLSECMSANPSSAVIALQFQSLDRELHATELASRCPNISAYCRDGAIINGIKAPWKIGDPPSKNWEIIRAEYWKDGQFLLGDFKILARFLAMSGGGKSRAAEPVAEEIPSE
ncbi:SIR2 family protein [Achromobacter dolens]|uniref:SIR2 family protein n=1 Tax=Achromobacter dolens TaxID=1287738 RepID=UPI0011A5AD7B|nr:SIR2 family protein [Achromobacter dolens]